MPIIYSKEQLQKIADKTLLSMKQRILAGKDKTDSPFKAYSSRTFAMPSGATTKSALKKLGKSGVEYFKTSSGATWVVILGGYVALKKARNPSWAGVVDLSVTGAMLRSMAVLSIGENSFKIGFTRSEEAQKMAWQIAKGRDPMGLSPTDLQSITPLLNTGFTI